MGWWLAWCLVKLLEWKKNIRDQVVPVLVLLEAAEGHLGAGDVLLGVLEVVELETMLGSTDTSETLTVGRL